MRLMELAELHRFRCSASSTSPAPIRCRGRAARAGRNDRPLTGLEARLGVPIVTCVIGEGRLRRCDCDRARRPRADAGERDLHRHLSGRLRGHSLRDAGEAKKAACGRSSRTPSTAFELGVHRRDRPEPEGGAHMNHDEAARLWGKVCQEALEDLESVPPDDLKRRRRGQIPLVGRLRLSQQDPPVERNGVR